MGRIKISDEQIAAKKDIFLSSIEREKELAVNGRASEIQTFLNKIKELVETAVKQGLSYKQIAKSIYSTWNVKVSDQTVKRFAENTLGIKKEERVKKEVPLRQSIETKSTDLKPIQSQIAAPVAESLKDEPKEHKTDGVKKAPADFDDI